MQAVAFASPDTRMGPPTGIATGPRKDIKPELLLEGIDVWLQEPLVRRQISPTLAQIIKTSLSETYMRLALLPTPMKPSATASPKELVWCCMAFMAYNVGGRAGNERKRLQIDKLLEHCKYPLTVFFKEQRTIASVVMPFFAKIEGLTLEALEQRTQVRELQMSFVYSAAIMRRYKELFSNKFDLSTPSHPASDPNYRLGWLIFLAAKAKLLPPNPDLFACFNLLVAVFNVLVAHMPKRRLHLGPSGLESMTATAKDGRIDTAASLAAMHQAGPAEVAALVAKLDHLLQDILKEKGLEQGPHPDEAKVSVSCQHWPGLLEDADVRRRAITAVEDAYLAANEASGAQYDEQVHLEPDISVGGIPMSPLRAAPRVSQYSSAPSSSQLHSAGVSTPIRNGIIATVASPAPTPRVVGAGAVPSTPRTPRGSADGVSFSDAISCTSWLREITGFAEAAPSEGLLRFFRGCGGSDKTQEVTSRARLVEQVFPGSREHQQDALKVYYRVLENVLEAEERRSSSQGVEGLLSSNSFHTCMLACASEVVVACYKIITLPFPEVPERLGLKAFDIFKIIQCFVRHEPSLPRGVKRHLVGIEEQVVESLAMAPGSSMFPSLVFAQQALRLSGPRPPRAVPQQRTRQVKRAIGFNTEEEGGSSDAVPTPPESQGSASSASGLPTLAKIKTARVGALQHGKPPVSPRVSGLQQPSTPVKASTATGFHLIPSPAPKKLRVNEAGSSAPAPSSRAEVKQEPQLQLQALQQLGHSRSQLPQSIGEEIEAPSFMDGPIVLLVRDFFKKACILSWVRLAQLCEHMDFGAHNHGDLLSKVYGVVRFGLFERTSLLYGRHLDQILLCALYGVCKVLRLEGMTFKELTTHYKRQAGINTGASLRQEVFRNVVIDYEGDTLEPKECGDIISFYNKVFIPAMKPALMNLGSTQGSGDTDQQDQQQPLSGIKTVPASPLARQMIPGSPLRNSSGPGGPFADLPGMGAPGIPMSPIKTQVAANYNVFVSPMRNPIAAHTAMTPRTNQLFCVGDSSPMILAQTLADFGEASLAGAMEWQPGSDTSTEQGRSENSSEQSTGGESMQQ